MCVCGDGVVDGELVFEFPIFCVELSFDISRERGSLMELLIVEE